MSLENELMGMVAAENFNKSFPAVAMGDFDRAVGLIQTHFNVSADRNDGVPGSYGLIAIANLLSARGDIEGAAEVAFVARRLFAEEGIVPDPADEKPLANVESTIEDALSGEQRAAIKEQSLDVSVSALIEKYLQ